MATELATLGIHMIQCGIEINLHGQLMFLSGIVRVFLFCVATFGEVQ